MMTPEITIELLQLSGVIVGGAVALVTYRRDSKLRRTEWIYRLYQQFYENDQFKPVRRIIDYGPAEQIDALRIDVEKDAGTALHESLVDYLNFFEFIAVQVRKGNLKRAEVLDMFDYYVRRLKDHDFIMRYLKTNGFENLDALLRGLKGIRSAK